MPNGGVFPGICGGAGIFGVILYQTINITLPRLGAVAMLAPHHHWSASCGGSGGCPGTFRNSSPPPRFFQDCGDAAPSLRRISCDAVGERSSGESPLPGRALRFRSVPYIPRTRSPGWMLSSGARSTSSPGASPSRISTHSGFCIPGITVTSSTRPSRIRKTPQLSLGPRKRAVRGMLRAFSFDAVVMRTRTGTPAPECAPLPFEAFSALPRRNR